MLGGAVNEEDEMQAMKGSNRAGIRHRRRLLGCTAALLALAAMTVPSLAVARVKPSKVTNTYVALGDSLAFGFSEHEFNESLPTENPANFEAGYPNDYLALIDEASPYRKAQLVNYGCPGETTESLIGDNPTVLAAINKALKHVISEPVTGEAPCAYHYKDGFPLHDEYGAGQSQLEAAIATVEREKAAHTPVKTITLDIGANDELHEVAKATKEAEAAVEAKVAAIVTPEAEAEVKAKVKQIITEEIEAYVVEQVLPQALEESGGEEPALREDIAKDAAEYVANNPGTIKSLEIRDGGKYLEAHGKELKEEGERIGEELGAAYAAENAAKLHEEGEQIGLRLITEALPAEFEQIDTNIIGIGTALRQAKRLHIGKDNYHGRIVFEATYDPYGRVGGVSQEHKELEPGFNAAAAELASFETATITGSPVGACYVDAETLFNPALSIPDKGSYDEAELELIEKEEFNLANWTNMANFTEFQYEPGKFLKYGEKVKIGPHEELELDADGPDIHATATGYKEMAGQMKSTCGV
jgi:hypothetical protein